MIPTVNCLFLNTAKFNKGVDSRYWRNTNNATKTIPPIIDTNTIGLSNPFSEIELVPYNNPPKPSTEKMTEIKSIGTLIVVPTFFIVLNPIKNVTAAIGATTWKSDLQLKYSTR